MAQHSDARRTLWFLWLSVTALGLGIGAGLAELVSSAVASESGYHLLFWPRWQIAVGLCLGAPVLLMQYFVLRAFLPESLRWMAATTLGLLIGAAVGVFAGAGCLAGDGCSWASPARLPPWRPAGQACSSSRSLRPEEQPEPWWAASWERCSAWARGSGRRGGPGRW